MHHIMQLKEEICYDHSESIISSKINYTLIISSLLPIVTFQKNYFCINIFCIIHFFPSVGLLETLPFKIHR